MATKTVIFNTALTLLGQDPIADPDGSGKKETACRQVYDVCRKALLEQHPWNFALKRANLDQESEAPAFEYTYAYGLPTDCLRIYRIYDPSSIHKEEGGLLLSNDSGVKLLYIRNIEDTSQFPPLFVQMLAVDIAIAIEYFITNGQSMAQSLMIKRSELLKMAKMIDAQKDTSKTFQSVVIQSAEHPYGDI